MFASRTRPCLLHQIRRCSAPCVGLIGEAEYAALVEDAVLFLTGRSTKVQESLAAAMAEASRAMAFERAAALRDRIRALTNVQASQGVNPEGVEEADVVALHQEGGQAGDGEHWEIDAPRGDKGGVDHRPDQQDHHAAVLTQEQQGEAEQRGEDNVPDQQLAVRDLAC